MAEPTDLPIISNQQENEITIFAKVGDFEGLKQADTFEEQIQITAKLGLGENTCRVRRSVLNDEVKYVYTFKVKDRSEHDSVTSMREHNVDVNESFYQDFKHIADYCQDKVRYIFNSEKITFSYSVDNEDKVIEVPDIKYEVDVFKKPDGSLSEWCKIDIEVDQLMQYVDHNYPDLKNVKLNIKISHLPFKPTDSWLKVDSDAEVMGRIDTLYQNEFTVDLVALRQNASQAQINEVA
jgi:hypothetical protein